MSKDKELFALEIGHVARFRERDDLESCFKRLGEHRFSHWFEVIDPDFGTRTIRMQSDMILDEPRQAS